jgi:hypothetical protein
MSVKRKNTRIIVYSGILSLLLLLFILPILFYRMPISRPEIITAEIKYQLFDFGFDDPIRNYIENKSGNHRVFINHPSIKCFYINPIESKMLGFEQIRKMIEEHYTIEATFKVRKNLLGGYCLAQIIDTTHVSGRPDIHK